MALTGPSLRTMWLVLLMYHCCLIVQGQVPLQCAGVPSFREPVDADITVDCGTEAMDLSILICPVYFTGYNDSLMALNALHAKPECHGIPDWTVDPPVLRFNLKITEDAVSTCHNKLTITQTVGSGTFADYSSIQFVNISGIINSLDPSAATITYKQQMMYIYSCRYPLQYLVNNTQMSVSGVSIAINDNNGSFISTLSMGLYEDDTYSTLLIIPDNGLKLKKKIFVEVKASNLTERFNVLLDRCYATINPFPSNSTFYDLFVGCNHDGQTIISVNGDEQIARFSFEAFRFVVHKDQTVSTFYLHCATRLCEQSQCESLRPNCNQSNIIQERAADVDHRTSVSDVATVSSGPIKTQVDGGSPIAYASEATARVDRVIQGVAIGIGILSVLCIALVFFIIYQIYTKRSDEKRPFN